MALTWAEMKTEIRGGLGNRTDLNDRLEVIGNMAQDRIAAVEPWDDLHQTYEGTFTITATAATDKKLALSTVDATYDVKDIYSFRTILGDGSSNKLERKLTRQFDAEIPEPEYHARRKPQIYTRYQRILEVWPVPDLAYDWTIRASRWPIPFTSSGDSANSSLLHKDGMIIALSLAYAFDSLARAERATHWWRVYTRMLNEAVQDERESPDRVIKPADRSVVSGGEYWKDPFVRSV